MNDDELLLEVEKLIETTDNEAAKSVLHALAGSLIDKSTLELALSCRMFVIKRTQQLDPFYRKN